MSLVLRENEARPAGSPGKNRPLKHQNTGVKATYFDRILKIATGTTF